MRPVLAPFLVLAPLALAACSNLSGDPLIPPDASGQRVAQIQDPSSTYHRNNATAEITSAVVTWLDTFDETRDGKSVGTLYIQDVGSSAAYAGIGIFQPNYIPASLTVLPGDVLDFKGPYQESTAIGSAAFTAGTFLPQLSKPVGTFRYEFMPPPPVELKSTDLDGNNANFTHGRQWIGMLVTLKDVTVAKGAADTSGRVTYAFGTGTSPITGNSVALSNELYDLSATKFPTKTHFTSVTGIVTWFYSFHVAPRTPDDLVP